jgi:flagellar protein FlaI
MLGFSCRGTAELNFPEIGENEEKLLGRFLELYPTKGDVLPRLMDEASRKFSFSKESVAFWAERLVNGRFGPIDPLLSLDLEEIMVNGLKKPVYVYDRKKGMLQTNLAFEKSEYFAEIANRMLSSLGRRVNQANPRESGVLENGDRVSVVIPPYSRDFIMSIRKYSAEPFTIPDLIDREMLSPREAALLWMVMECGNINVGVVGNTGSGKTTLLNSLLHFVPKKSRMIVVEEIPEVRIMQDQSVNILSNKNLGLEMKDAIIDSLRLRPDRVVIGEVRSAEEVEALGESCMAGHALGTYFTYHAESAEMACKRLISQGFPEHSLGVIHLIVTCKRFETKGRLRRKVVGISGPLGKKFASEYLDLAFPDFSKELSERKNFLENCRREGSEKFFREVCKWT